MSTSYQLLPNGEQDSRATESHEDPDEKKKGKKAKEHEEESNGTKKDEEESRLPLVPIGQKLKVRDVAAMSVLTTSSASPCTLHGITFACYWHLLLFGFTIILQFALVYGFHQLQVNELQAMYKEPQVTLMKDIMNKAILENATMRDVNQSITFSAPGSPFAQWINYTGVAEFAMQKCYQHVFVTAGQLRVIYTLVAALLIGKFLHDTYFFFQNAYILLMKVKRYPPKNAVESKDRDKEPTEYLSKAFKRDGCDLEITHARRGARFFSVFGIYLPYVLFIGYLTYVGCTFLLVTPSIGRMVKAFLKVYFAQKISELLATAYTSEKMKKMTKGTYLVFNWKPAHPREPNLLFNVQSWGLAFCIFFLSLVLALVFQTIAGASFNEMGALCDDYLEITGIKNPLGNATCFGQTCGISNEYVAVPDFVGIYASVVS